MLQIKTIFKMDEAGIESKRTLYNTLEEPLATAHIDAGMDMQTSFNYTL